MSYLFAFLYCSWGSQGKNAEVVCHSLPQIHTHTHTHTQGAWSHMWRLRPMSPISHVGSSSPNRIWTKAACIGSTESWPLDHLGSPCLYHLNSYSIKVNLVLGPDCFPSLAFFSNVLGILVPFHLHVNFRISLSIYTHIPLWGFNYIAFKTNLWRIFHEYHLTVYLGNFEVHTLRANNF